MLTYDTPALWQTGSRNLMGPKTLPTIWGTYMKLVTKYQISAINSCWEKCDEKCAYMFNVYKNQLNRQTGSRNLMGPKTIWGTYMKLVTKYQIPVINSCWEKRRRKISIYSKTPLYCPSIHRQTRVSPRISAVPFSVCSNNPVKMPNSLTPSATVIEDQMVNLLLFKPRS